MGLHFFLTLCKLILCKKWSFALRNSLINVNKAAIRNSVKHLRWSSWQKWLTVFILDVGQSFELRISSHLLENSLMENFIFCPLLWNASGGYFVADMMSEQSLCQSLLSRWLLVMRLSTRFSINWNILLLILKENISMNCIICFDRSCYMTH